jgi:hypothetical protein
MEFKKDLQEILEEMAAIGNFKTVAVKMGNVRCYLAFFRIKFEERGLKPVPAKHLIRALQEIYESNETPDGVKTMLAEMFAEMDPRDSKNRYGDCDCLTCKPSPKAKEEFLKKIKEITGGDMKIIAVDGFGETISKVSH